MGYRFLGMIWSSWKESQSMKNARLEDETLNDARSDSNGRNYNQHDREL